jgi:hypothetical protein
LTKFLLRLVLPYRPLPEGMFDPNNPSKRLGLTCLIPLWLQMVGQF